MNRKNTGQFEILDGYTNTAPFLAQVTAAADAHRNALGFVPNSVFDEFARNDRLYVLAERRAGELCYAGHLLFRRRFPRTHVMQMFTLSEYRRFGLATKLISHLCSSLTRDGFTSIYARVAEDLVDANAFWDKQKFYIQRIERGGASRNRQILVRCHELASPQLFPSSGISAHDPLGLMTSSSSAIPLFLLDLNVLYDLAPRRLRRDEAASLFQAERMNFCRLAISNEIREELVRTASQGKTDPMEAFINIFPSFPLLQGDNSQNLIKELSLLIFSNKLEEEKLTANDRSDLCHVATVIQHNLAGLITNDGAILAAAPRIQTKYGVEVISPSAFTLDGVGAPVNNAFETAPDTTLTLLEVSRADESAVYALLAKIGLSGSTIAAGWLPAGAHGRVAMCCAVWDGTILVGYAVWIGRGAAGSTTVRVAVDETNQQALHAARILLLYLLENLAFNGPTEVRLELPSQQSHVRELAVSFGFQGTSDQYCLIKLILGRVLTGATWDSGQRELGKKVAMKIPDSIPKFRSIDQHIQVLTPDGNQRHITLDVLETLLSPALLCLPGRQAVITPVKGNFSGDLLGCSPQGSLLPQGTVSLFRDRHYLSGPNTLRNFKRGTLILFYESTRHGGRGEIVAIARVREAYLRSCDALEVADLRPSVLTTTSLNTIGKSKMKTVTVFDNIFPLHRPVSLSSLQRLGCGRPNDLITTRTITDAQLQEILSEAFDRE